MTKTSLYKRHLAFDGAKQKVKRKDFQWKKTFLIRFCTLGQSALNSLGNKQFPRGVLCNLGHCCVNCPVSVSPPKSDQNVTSQKMLQILSLMSKQQFFNLFTEMSNDFMNDILPWAASRFLQSFFVHAADSLTHRLNVWSCVVKN